MNCVRFALCAFVVLAVSASVNAERIQLSANAEGLDAAVEQMMGAISVEQAAMAATMASHDGPTRRLKQASAGAVQQAMSSFASALPTIQNLATLTQSSAASTGGSSAAAAVSGGIAAAAAAAALAPPSIFQAKAALEAELNQYCTPAEFTQAKLKPAKWTGQGFTLALLPHSCQIFPANHTLACAPAQIVLLKSPAKWNQAYTAPASYVGKFCQLVHTLGNSTTKVLGAAPYTVPIPAEVPIVIPKYDFHHLHSYFTDAPAAAPAAGSSAASSAAGK